MSAPDPLNTRALRIMRTEWKDWAIVTIASAIILIVRMIKRCTLPELFSGIALHTQNTRDIAPPGLEKIVLERPPQAQTQA
jgi:hypothetical protein